MGYLARGLLLLAFLAPLSALAGWMDRFEEEALGFGMETAVENALDDDVTVRDILGYAVSHRELFNESVVLRALYCAGADREEVREEADRLGISVEEVSVALEEAIAECPSKQSLTDRDMVETPLGSDPAGVDAISLPLPPTDPQAPLSQ